MSRFLLALVLLSGCAGQVEAPHDESVCYAHGAGDFLSAAMACDVPTAPSCGFGSDNTPYPISPDYPIEFVCHCIGGVYSCFGRQP